MMVLGQELSDQASDSSGGRRGGSVTTKLARLSEHSLIREDTSEHGDTNININNECCLIDGRAEKATVFKKENSKKSQM